MPAGIECYVWLARTYEVIISELLSVAPINRSFVSRLDKLTLCIRLEIKAGAAFRHNKDIHFWTDFSRLRQMNE